MGKILKGILIVFGVMILLSAFVGSNDEKKTDSSTHILTASEADSLRYRLTRDIENNDSCRSSLDSSEVWYNNKTKALEIDLIKRDLDTADNLQRIMTYNTMEILDIANKYSDDIDKVLIIGYAPMMDSKGNLLTHEGNVLYYNIYTVKTSMKKSKQVNWKNLEKSKDMNQAIKNNVDSIWWHPELFS